MGCRLSSFSQRSCGPAPSSLTIGDRGTTPLSRRRAASTSSSAIEAGARVAVDISTYPKPMTRVKVGVTLKMYDYRTYAPKTLADIASQAARAEQLGFDSVWVMDHVFIQRGGRRVLAHDPLLSLAHVAAATRSITIGTLVLCYPFRSTGQLAREASALADMSGGRFVLGLGAGWHLPEFDALDVPFDHKVARLEEAVDPLQRLLRGETVDFDGRWLTLRGASVAVTSPAPRTWIAADGPRMMRVAARTDGWQHANWGASDTAPIRAAVARL